MNTFSIMHAFSTIEMTHVNVFSCAIKCRYIWGYFTPNFLWHHRKESNPRSRHPVWDVCPLGRLGQDGVRWVDFMHFISHYTMKLTVMRVILTSNHRQLHLMGDERVGLKVRFDNACIHCRETKKICAKFMACTNLERFEYSLILIMDEKGYKTYEAC